MSRRTRFGLVALLATALVGAAAGLNLGLWGRLAASLPGSPNQPHPTSASAVPDEYSVMRVYHQDLTHDFPAPRLAPAEPLLIAVLMASGIGIRRIEALDGSHSLYGQTVIHRIITSQGVAIYEATSLALPPDDSTCRLSKSNGYQIVLSGFTFTTGIRARARFGIILHRGVVWTADSGVWTSLARAGATEIVCTVH